MAEETIELWSPAFASEEIDTMTCTLEKSAWTSLMNSHEGSRRLFAKIDCGDKTLYSAVGSFTESIVGVSERKRVILPYWALDVLSTTGMGDLAQITWLSEDAFPPATRIILRPHDSAFYHSDAKEELEFALTRLGVLQKGQTIMVCIQALGDFPMSFDVVECEPAHIVLADGEEVVMEFEAALDLPPEPIVRPDTPLPETTFGPMLPEVEPPVITGGRRLGGTNRVTSDGRAWNPHRDG
jgi:hypothetical protein